MKYILLIPILGLSLVQVVTWFGVLPPAYLSVFFSVGCVIVFIVGIIIEKRHATRSGVSLGQKVLENLSFKPFIVGLVLVGYFFFNFFYSASLGGNTRIEDGRYFAMKEPAKVFYEISESEYNERQPHQLRAKTGHPLLIGIVGFIIFCAGRSSNKSSKRGAAGGVPSRSVKNVEKTVK